MDYKKTETEIIEATKDFATINNIHYDELTESMILNAMRELNKCFIADVSGMLILTPKDVELFFNEVMNPKKANEALKKAMLKFITR
tara:strand:+ start:257 stop:517 length:261 start_codon:yes stop_codon:yes gene_type:complete